MRSFLIAAASVACIAVGSAHAADVSANPADQTETRRLSVAQVDFRDPSAVRALYGRLHQAAVEACDAGSVGMGRAVDRNPECTAQALNAAINKIDRPLLTAEFRQHEAIRTARGY
jgi:UrcA family protein